MRCVPNFTVRSLNPSVWVRSAWIEPSHVNSDIRLLPIGDAIAFEFGNGHRLVCTPRTSQSVDSVYARWIPSSTSMDDLIAYETSKQCPIRSNGQWHEFSCLLGVCSSKPAESRDWIITTGHHELHLMKSDSVHPSLIVRNTFGLVELVQTQPHQCQTEEHSSDFCRRYPPIYPKDERQAWGWLLPTANHQLEAQGFTFTSVMHFALNPVLRKRATGRKGCVIDEIPERLAFGAECLTAQNAQFTKLLKHQGMPVKQLSEQAPAEHKPYWRVLTKAKQQAP